MKYMPQDVFDTCVLVLAVNMISQGDERYEYVKQSIEDSYRKAYAGDSTFIREADALVEPVIKYAHDTFGEEAMERCLAEAVHILGDLDENLEPKRGMRRVFNGTVFTKGHPNPGIRRDQGMKDIKRLLTVVKIHEIQRAHGIRR